MQLKFVLQLSIVSRGSNCQKIGELRCNLVFLELSLAGRKQVFRAFDERGALSDSRDRYPETLRSLPASYKALENPDAYPVQYTTAFTEMLTREKLEAARRPD
jgi:hypothetical protein